MNAPVEKLASCSFCGKTQRQVRKLIAGPSVYICDECIDLCNDIIEEELGPDAKQPVRLPYGEAARLYELLQNAFENDNAPNLTAMDVALVNRLQRAVGAPPSE